MRAPPADKPNGDQRQYPLFGPEIAAVGHLGRSRIAVRFGHRAGVDRVHDRGAHQRQRSVRHGYIHVLALSGAAAPSNPSR